MKTRFFRNTAALILAFTLTAACAFAQSAGKSSPKSSPSTSSKTISDKDNPTLIGKRNINKGTIEFYSIEREVALGRRLAYDVDRSSKIINDPFTTEYVNRIAQNLVLHSDSKVPFTIKVVDSEVVNAFALPGGFLYVNRGLLEAADNEAEVAGGGAPPSAHLPPPPRAGQAPRSQPLHHAFTPPIRLRGRS